MEKTIAQRIQSQKTESVYIVAAKKFNTNYKYVWMLARGERSGSRGKGKLIKEFLETQLKNN